MEVKIGDAHTGAVHDVSLREGDGRQELLNGLAKYYNAYKQENIIVLGRAWQMLENRSIDLWESSGHIDCFMYDRSVIKGGPGSGRLGSHAEIDEEESGRRLDEMCVPESIEAAEALGLLISSEDGIASSSTAASEDSSSSAIGPLQRALTDFESSFRLRLAQGRAYVQRCKLRADACIQKQERQRVRDRAVWTAIENLKEHCEALTETHTNFLHRAERHSAAQREVLMRFESDLEALTKKMLHPALVASCDAFAEGATLADCVNFKKARAWAETCAKSLAAFEVTIDRVGTVVHDINTRVQILYHQYETNPSDNEAKRLEAGAAFCVYASCASQGKEELASLESDAKLASRLVAESSQSSTDPTSALEVCRRLQDCWDARATLIPVMAARDSEAMQSASKCTESFNALHGVDTLRTISELQSSIHRVRTHHLSAQSDALRDKARLFAQLETVRKLPRSHQALCLEIARRRAYARASKSQVRVCAESLAELRLEETDRRNKFQSLHGACLPKILIKALPGLAEMPLVFSPTFEPDPTHPLPEIDTLLDEEDSSALPRESMTSIPSSTNIPTLTDDHNHETQDKGGAVVLSASKRLEPDIPLERERHERDVFERAAGRTEHFLARPSSPDLTLLDQIEGVLQPFLPSNETTNKASNMRTDRMLATVSALSAAALLTSKTNDDGNPVISFCSLDIGDVALFTPFQDRESLSSSMADAHQTSHRVDYLAFHRGRPNRFLARSIADAIVQSHSPPPDFVLGRITSVKSCRSTKEYNPFGLALDTAFFELRVDPL